MSDINSQKIKQRFQSGISWEPIRGYSRAMRVGDRLLISGTVAVNDKAEVQAVGDPYKQTRYILEHIKVVLKASGFSIREIVRTRVMLTDYMHWKEIARAHQEIFEKIRPSSTVIMVPRLIDPRLLVELEIEAEKHDEERETIAVDFSV